MLPNVSPKRDLHARLRDLQNRVCSLINSVVVDLFSGTNMRSTSLDSNKSSKKLREQ